MTPALGLVCITASKKIRYRRLTRKRLQSLDPTERERALLALYRTNLETLSRVPAYCAALGIRLYRLPSDIFPFSDEPLGVDLLGRLEVELAALGARVEAAGLRLVMHPDQFVVLNSESPNVVANSVKILEMHARILDALRQPRTPWATIELHGGKRGRAGALIDAVGQLPASVRHRLALENDEIRYGADEMLEICGAAGVPMVFDVHHHLCFERLDSYENASVAETTAAARATWPDPAWQLVHVSNGRQGLHDRSHSDEIEIMPSAFADVPWIEVEAKRKEDALRRLQAEWLPRVAGRRRGARTPYTE